MFGSGQWVVVQALWRAGESACGAEEERRESAYFREMSRCESVERCEEHNDNDGDEEERSHREHQLSWRRNALSLFCVFPNSSTSKMTTPGAKTARIISADSLEEDFLIEDGFAASSAEEDEGAISLAPPTRADSAEGELDDGETANAAAYAGGKKRKIAAEEKKNKVKKVKESHSEKEPSLGLLPVEELLPKLVEKLGRAMPNASKLELEEFKIEGQPSTTSTTAPRTDALTQSLCYSTRQQSSNASHLPTSSRRVSRILVAESSFLAENLLQRFLDCRVPSRNRRRKLDRLAC